MNPIKSVIARSQNFSRNHFKVTPYYKKLRSLYRTHNGESCFIIGNGPSLRPEDLEKLSSANVHTFAANRIYKMFDKTYWRPTYFACEDPIIIKDIEGDINRIECKYKFIPINLKYDLGVNINGACYINMKYNRDDSNNYGFLEDIASNITCNGTVTITSIQLAAYMGYKDIYLIGVDHSYSKMVNDKGEIIEDKSVKDYFDDSYDSGIKNELVHNMDEATKSFYRARLYYKNKGVNIYNATRGGKLEVFPRVNFDELNFQNWKR